MPIETLLPIRPAMIHRLVAVINAVSLIGLSAAPAVASEAGPEPVASSAPAITCTEETEPNHLPEEAMVLASELCLTGTLPEQPDQDLVFWDVLPAESLLTWRFTIEGIPTTITSLYLFKLFTDPGVFPVDTDQLFRVDSDATSPTPGVLTGVSLPTGRYLLGVSRGNPAQERDAPPGTYRVTIEREQPLPPLGDIEPNDDAVSASPVADPIDLSGAWEGDPDFYRWTVAEDEAAARWQLGLHGVPGDDLALTLQAQDGTPMAATTTSAEGEAHLYDLELPAGAYDIVVTGSGAGPFGYFLSSSRSEAAGTDPEPNDAPEQALPMAIGEQRVGRLAGPRDFDQYSFTVPPSAADDQVDVSVRVESALSRRLCLTLLPNEPIGCRGGSGDLEFSNLLLSPGSYLVSIDGDEDLAAGYELSVADLGPVVADREIEPNDDLETATLFDPAQVLRGRSAPDDKDYYRINVAGDRQVWRLDATGTDIRELVWLASDLEVLGSADVSADGTRASLWDMDLAVGDHWIAIRSNGRDYELTLTPLGATAAGSEREPNDDSANAEALKVDQPRTGRLRGAADVDVYRFSLDATERVSLDLEPPADAAIRMRLTSGTQELARVREPTAGAPIVYQAELHPGDYEVELQSDSGSALAYTLRLEREDPFAPLTDLEPDDTQATARPVPPDLRVSGRGHGALGEDHDWYELPPLGSEAGLTITAAGDVRIENVRDGSAGVRVVQGEDGTTWTTDPVPTGTVIYVEVSGSGEYALAFASEGLVEQDPVGELPARVELLMDANEVAAYTELGQRVPGVLRIGNDGADDLELSLDFVTTQLAWRGELGSPDVVVPAGEAVEVPLAIIAPKDAWADVPVRTTIRLHDGEGRQATVATDITPRRDVALVGPEPWWPVPEAMLGGLDVASLALGASLVDALDPADESLLHDGVAMTGIGYRGWLGDGPLVFTVDLAGDEPVPVAGMIVDPLAGIPALATSPRHVELSLSLDGSTWTPALAAELTSLQQEQPLALPEPVPARFARLEVSSTYGEAGGYVSMGEWQVIASPDWVPAFSIDIAEPAHGGHVASVIPGASNPTETSGMLSNAEGETPWTPFLEAETTVSWVVGFHEDRLAQVTALEWLDRDPSDPTMRFDEVAVEVSTHGALGPWEEAGRWRLERGPDGSVPPYELPVPTWARFIRFSGKGPAERGYWEMPAGLRVLERSVDAEYRSILGAWGRNDASGIFERLLPPDPSALQLGFDLSDGNDTLETASPLELDVAAEARILRGADIDWYALTIPPDENTLGLTLVSTPGAGLALTLQDASGDPVELEPGPSRVPGGLGYEADVVPGQTYHLRVEQPPFSTVFTYDASGSMGPYLSYVSAALRGFAADITPGEEAVLVLPFDGDPLVRHWSDDPYELETAVAGVGRAGSSSAAETALLEAARALHGRPGAQAILVITDANTSSFQRGAELWHDLEGVRPVIFAVHVAGGEYPALTRQLMQDWAYSWGGHYEYAFSQGQIARAFDRLAAWFRRPAAYSISYHTSYVSHEPGNLSLDLPADSERFPIAGSGVAVEIVLDTSASMLKRVDGARRIDVAREVLAELVGSTLPAGIPTALRIFRPGRRVCDGKLISPLAPLDPEAMTAQVQALKVNKHTRTPIGATLKQVPGDLGDAEGLRIVVLITDGKESCKGDPEQSIRDLMAAGFDVRLDIIGFEIDDEALKAQIEGWAALGNGQAFSAEGSDELAASIRSALAAPFRVIDADGVIVARGTVGGDQVQLPPSTYEVEVLTDPVMILDPVEIKAEQSVTMTVESPSAP